MRTGNYRKWIQAFCVAAGLCAGAVMSAQAQTVRAELQDVIGDVVEAVTPPEAVTNLTVSDCEVDSITLSWMKSPDAETYEISYWEPGKAASTTVGPVDAGNVSAYVVTGLKKQTQYHFTVYSAKYLADSKKTVLSLKNASLDTATAPEKPGMGDIEFNTTKKGYCSCTIKNMPTIYKTETRLYDLDKTFLGAYDGTDTSVSIKSSKIKENCFYCVRVNGYYENSDGSRSSGELSEYCYFGTRMSIPSASQKSGRISATWEKVQGADSYTVYISQKPDSGFRKVKTVNKLSASISKCGNAKLKSKKTYYVRVEADCTVDGSAFVLKSAARKITMK